MFTHTFAMELDSLIEFAGRLALTFGSRYLITGTYFANSSGNHFITDVIGFAAIWPNPQIEVAPIVAANSLTTGNWSAGKRRASMSPVMSTSFCEPNRHGTHLPHDSLR